jgi:hypothetical protein
LLHVNAAQRDLILEHFAEVSDDAVLDAARNRPRHAAVQQGDILAHQRLVILFGEICGRRGLRHGRVLPVGFFPPGLGRSATVSNARRVPCYRGFAFW